MKKFYPFVLGLVLLSNGLSARADFLTYTGVTTYILGDYGTFSASTNPNQYGAFHPQVNVSEPLQLAAVFDTAANTIDVSGEAVGFV